MKRISQIYLGRTELRTLCQGLCYLVFMAMTFFIVTVAFLLPKRTLAEKGIIELAVINDVDGLFKVERTGCSRIELAAPVIKAEGHV